MGNGYNSSRDLQYRLPKNIRIKYTLGDVTRKAKYTGESNMVIYRDTRMSINKFCRQVKEELIPGGKSNVNAWISAYVSMKDKDRTQTIKVLLKNIPILPEYKKHENEILNNQIKNYDLKIKEDNDINSKNINSEKNMPRGKSKVNANVSTKKPHVTKEERDLNRRVREFEIKTSKWWDKQRKEEIMDLDEYSRLTFAIRKLKGEDNVYEMLNKYKQRVGIIHPWVDKEGKYPPEFKNEDNVVTPFGVPEYEYVLEKDCSFHSLPRTTYYKYKFTKVFKKFILTDEIREFKED